MIVHLVDGTWELFRHHYGSPRSARDRDGTVVTGVVGVMRSMASMLADGATHLGIATDHVVESFRNDLYAGYKSSEGLDPEILGQFGPLEEAIEAMGIKLFAMVDREADDGLASAARTAAADDRVEKVMICSPDKDLAQCVGGKVYQFDRLRRELRDTEAVIEKFGVPPASIPDYLGLVGDTSDGFPGLPGFGAKSSAALLARYGHIEHIPPTVADWDITLRGAAKLSVTLQANIAEALLFRQLAVLQPDPPVIDNVDELVWQGPRPELAELCERLQIPEFVAELDALSR